MEIHSFSVWRFNSLLEHHQELPNTGFAGAIGAEEQRQWRHFNLAGVLPAFEILDA